MGAVAFSYQTVLAWTVALLICQGGTLLGQEGDMGAFDFILMVVILGTVWLL